MSTLDSSRRLRCIPDVVLKNEGWMVQTWSQKSISTILEKKFKFLDFHVVVLEDLYIGVSINNLGLIFTR